jgi:ABC-2 type transport system ATP-binding protein
MTIAAASAISIRGLRVVRGGSDVLCEIDLDVESGTVTGLLGPSGSGKTTLIRSVVGVQIVAAGSITVLGRPAGAPELRSHVGYMTQAPSVYGDLTVEENLEVLQAHHARARLPSRGGRGAGGPGRSLARPRIRVSAVVSG